MPGMPEPPVDDGIQLDLFPEPGEARRSPVQVPHPGLLPSSAPIWAEEDDPAAFAEAGALQRSLQRLLPDTQVDIRYTRNRTVILSIRPDRKGRPVLRAHMCFRTAPDDIADAAIRLYLTRANKVQRRRWSHVVTLYHQQAAEPPETVASAELRPGIHHDLRAILERVNAEWFESKLELDITYGDRIARRLMGRHEKRSPRNLIIVNPILDHAWVTEWYLEFLVFHECLHEVYPPRPSADRMILHPPEFRAHERKHPDLERARKYERWLTGPGYKKLERAAQEKISEAT